MSLKLVIKTWEETEVIDMKMIKDSNRAAQDGVLVGDRPEMEKGIG